MGRLVRHGAARAGIALALLLVGSVVLAACGSSEGSSSSSSGSGGSGESGKEHVNISFFVGEPSLSTYVLAKEGAEQAGAEDGAATVTVDGPSNPTESNTRQFAENMLQANEPDGFVADPCETTAWTTVWPKLASQVPNENVLSFNCAATPTPEEEAPPGATTLVAQSFKEVTAIGVEEAIKAANLPSSTTGKVLFAECYAGIPNQEQSAEAAEEVVGKLLPKTEVQKFISGLAANESIAKWTSALNKYPDVVLAAGACSVDTNTLTLLKERGVGGEYVAAAAESTIPETFKGIEEGKLAAGSSSDPWVQGYVAAKLVIEGARGKAFPEGWINTEVTPVTKANAAEYFAASNSKSKASELFLPKAKAIVKEIESHTLPLTDYWKYPR